MNLQDQVLKDLSNRLAQRLSTAAGDEILFLIQECAAILTEKQDNQTKVQESISDNHIGIWGKQRRPDGSSFFRRRPDRVLEQKFWADLEEFEVEPKTKRIIFLGESVARGHFYDPVYTPAQKLSEAVRTVSGLEKTEVLDLSRHNLTLSNLKYLLRQMPTLKPSAIVIFAGNNWSVPQSTGLQIETAELLKAGLGFASTLKLMEQLLAREVRAFVNLVKTFTDTQKVPITLIIPEFCLQDWRPSGARIEVPWMDPEALALWNQLVEQARQAFQSRSYARAAELSGQAVEIDKSTSAESLVLLGKSLEALSPTDPKARRFLEQAKDCALLGGEFWGPRPYTIAQQTLRDEATRWQIPVVDVPAIIQAQNCPIPGREWFHDYCHLTSKGIRVVMAHTAAKVSSTLTSQATPSVEHLLNSIAPPENTVEAEAFFLAAIHNSHYGQSQDLIEYQCRTAVQLDPKITESMQHYITLKAHSKFSWMSEAFPRVIAGRPTVRKYLYADGNAALLDLQLIDTFRKIQPDKQVQYGNAYESLLANHSPDTAEVDLLDPLYCRRSYFERSQNWMQRKVPPLAYFKAFTQTSRFPILRAQCQAAHIDVCLRTPYKWTAESTVQFKINGERVFSCDLTQSWKHFRVSVDANKFRLGENQLEIIWPIPHVDSKIWLAEICAGLELARDPGFFPVYGELHSLIVSK